MSFMCVHVHVSLAYSCRRLAYTLVCVNVALTVRAGVSHILEVVNQTGNQAATEITPENDRRKYCSVTLDAFGHAPNSR